MSKPAADLSANPLVNGPKLPYGAPPLDVIKPEHYLPAVEFYIAEARQQVEDIKNNRAPANFKNTIEALELSGHNFNRVTTIFGNVIGNNGNDELRGLEKQIDLLAVQFGSDVMMDAKLFSRIKEVYDQRDSLSLQPEQKMLLTETYKNFVRSGALLDDAQKLELRAVNEKLSDLGTNFRNNVLLATSEYEKVIDNEADLKGLPDRVKAQYKEAAEEKGLTGKWLIKLSPPPVDIAEYSENRALREEIYRARGNVAFGGKYDNRPVVLDIVEQREKKAKLLGFDTYAGFVLDNRMAKTPETVNEFLQKNEEVYRPAAAEFLKKVQDYAKKTDGLTDLQPWDLAIYSRKLKEETFSMNLEELRPYFNLENVMDGLRKHAEKLFNIEMTETKDKYPVYHPDVKVYEIKDKASGEMIGLFYGDYYARAGAKNNGAWMNTFRNRGLNEQGENEFSIVTNTCNFPKPTKDNPTLLSLDEVRTVFHEFGHGLHALLAKGDYGSLTGTNVKWDFVELPSQLQENWAQQKEVLDTFARHPKTGLPLDPATIQKIHDMENFDSAYSGLRQTFLGKLDMKWHSTKREDIQSVEKLEDGIVSSTWLFPRVAGTQSTSFGHLFSGGYAAGYYSYKWAEALEADVFGEFQKKGLYDKDSAERLRNTIYSQGGTTDPEALFVSMMGRKLDPDALFRREGLLEDKKPVNNNAPKPPNAHKAG